MKNSGIISISFILLCVGCTSEFSRLKNESYTKMVSNLGGESALTGDSVILPAFMGEVVEISYRNGVFIVPKPLQFEVHNQWLSLEYPNCKMILGLSQPEESLLADLPTYWGNTELDKWRHIIETPVSSLKKARTPEKLEELMAVMLAKSVLMKIGSKDRCVRADSQYLVGYLSGTFPASETVFFDFCLSNDHNRWGNISISPKPGGTDENIHNLLGGIKYIGQQSEASQILDEQ